MPKNEATVAASDSRRGLVQVAVLHDHQQRVLALQALDVGEGVAVDEQQVGEVAGLDLAQLVRAGP